MRMKFAMVNAEFWPRITSGYPVWTPMTVSPEMNGMETRPPASLSPESADSKSLVKTSPRSRSAPMSSAKSHSSPTQPLISEVQLLQWTIATGSPIGVVTRSISGLVASLSA